MSSVEVTVTRGLNVVGDRITVAFTGIVTSVTSEKKIDLASARLHQANPARQKTAFVLILAARDDSW